MAAYKSEFLAQHYKGQAASAASLHFWICGQAGAVGSTYAGADQCDAHRADDEPADQAHRRRGAGAGNAAAGGAKLSGQRPAWRSAERNLASPDDHRSGKSGREAQSAAPQVLVLWPDTWNNYYHPQTLAAAETVLDAGGISGASCRRGTSAAGGRSTTLACSARRARYLADVLDRMAPQIEAGHAVHLSRAELRQRLQG